MHVDVCFSYLLRGDVSDPVDTPIPLASPNNSNCGQATRWFINMKCTDGALASFSFFVGVAAILLQVTSLGSDHWLYTIEPRQVGNLTESNGEQKVSCKVTWLVLKDRNRAQGWNVTSTFQDFLFQFNSGYWRICRERFSQPNDNLTSMEIYYFSSKLFFSH